MRTLGPRVGFSLLTLIPGRVGGSETYARGLLGGFAGAADSANITVLANRQVAAAYGQLSGGGVELHEVSSYRAGGGLPARALAMATALALPGRAARDVPAGLDLLHLPLTVQIPRLALPTVVTVHDVRHLVEPSSGPRTWRRYRAAAYDRPARRAEAVVVLGEHARAALVERGGVSEERVTVIAPGVEHDVFSPRPTDDDERLGPLPERFVCYPANAWPHKNHERLLRALAAVPDRELGLVLAGAPGPGTRRLLRQAHRSGLEGRVRHVGHLPPPRLAALYRRADALVFPSLHEAFGLPPLEAMACGCPVACSGREGLAEACGDGALTFDPHEVEAIADAIDRITQDEALRRRLTAAGPRRAAAFRWETAAAAHSELYRSVAARAASRQMR